MANKINHISFIMDGNKRWSKKKNIALSKSYNYGVNNLFKMAEYCFYEYEIDYVSAFALSSHNMSRSKGVIKPIIKLLDFYLDEFINRNEKYKYNIRFIGKFDIFNNQTVEKIDYINTQKNYKKTLIIALNYSGSDDILDASRLLYKNKKLSFNNYLSTANFPNPDLLIRTGGFQRLSDYFLFQLSFTEFFFSKTLWPNFKINSLNTIINKFLKIERKFGK